MSTLKAFRWPALLGLAATLPLMVLEYVNRRQYREGYPIALFIILWLLAVGFFYLLLPMLADALEGYNPFKTHAGKPAKFILMALIGAFWYLTVGDQMPCFLGAPLCD
jgi:hypothetical protein